MGTHYRNLSCVLICLVNTIAQAGEWPFIAGPTFNSRTSDEELLEEWPESGPAVIWDRQLGQGYSSFAVRGRRCLPQYQSALGQFVLCLDLHTGKPLWEYRYESPYEAIGIYPGPRSTPTIAGESVFVTTPDGVLLALSLSHGKLLWSTPFQQTFHGEGTGFGYSASPLVVHDLILLPVGGKGAAVVAISTNEGHVVWQDGDDTASCCPVIPITFETEVLLVSYMENTLLIHDLQGNRVCRLPLSTGYDEHASLPLFEEPLLILSAPFRAGATAYKLSWVKNEDGLRRLNLEVAWQSKQMSNDVVTSAIHNGMLLGFDLKDPQSKAHRPSRGTFRGLDATSGKALWQNDEIGQANIICSGDQLLFFNDRGEILLGTANRSGCQIQSRAQVFQDEVCWTRPVLSAGKLLVRSHRQVVCMQVGKSDPGVTDIVTRPLSDLRTNITFNWESLLKGEREHPVMPFTGVELGRWYAACSFILLSLLLIWNTLFRRSFLNAPFASTCRMLCILAILALIAPALLNRNSAEFWFTWPIALFAILQAAVLTSDRATADPGNRNAHWVARGTGGLFLLINIAYFVILKKLGEPLLWTFLIGYLPAGPVCYWTARQLRLRSPLWFISFLLVLGFNMLFWGAACFQWIRHPGT